MFPARTVQTGSLKLNMMKDHIRQSVADILTTPLGSRVMLPEYGSRLFELVDRPMNFEWKLDIFAATAEAIRKWEPRVSLRNVAVVEAGAGCFTIQMEMIFPDSGESFKEEIKIDQND